MLQGGEPLAFQNTGGQTPWNTDVCQTPSNKRVLRRDCSTRLPLKGPPGQRSLLQREVGFFRTIKGKPNFAYSKLLPPGKNPHVQGAASSLRLRLCLCRGKLIFRGSNNNRERSQHSRAVETGNSCSPARPGARLLSYHRIKHESRWSRNSKKITSSYSR